MPRKPLEPVPDELLALQRLYHWERTAPDRIALTQPMGGGALREFTWAQLVDQSRRMATYLQAQGFPAGSKIAILSKNTAWWLMADFAIWMAGHVSVPLYPTLAADTVRQILDHSEARLLFIGKLDGFDAMRTGIRAGLPCVSTPLAPEANPGKPWEEIVAVMPPLMGEPVRASSELSSIIYTSGTTGMPKGVMHSFGTFIWSLQSGLKRVPLNRESRMLSYLPLAHIVERVLVEHGLLATGMHLYFAESLDTFAADLQRARPTCFFSVPRLWVKFQQGVHAKMPPAKLDLLLKIPFINGLVRKKILAALGLDQCQFAVGGAAPMPVDLLHWYAKLGLAVNEGYGMTENCGVSHLTVPGQPALGTVGPPYEGVESRINPPDGELQMRSPGVMLGYYKDPELTDAAFTADGWLHTGDKGQVDAAGMTRITGRVKDLFKTSKGKYVAPAPIEDKLVGNPAVEACCVVGANQGQPLALVMLNAEAMKHAQRPEGKAHLSAALSATRQHVNATLDPHEQLACLVVVREPWTVENGFVTPTFKVKRNRVDEVFAARYESWERSDQAVVWE
jgi:long-chain acyl-CoA synthetase